MNTTTKPIFPALRWSLGLNISSTTALSLFEMLQAETTALSYLVRLAKTCCWIRHCKGHSGGDPSSSWNVEPTFLMWVSILIGTEDWPIRLPSSKHLHVTLNPTSQISSQIHHTGQFCQTYGTNQNVLSLGNCLILERCDAHGWICTYFFNYIMLLKNPMSTSHENHWIIMRK